MIESYYLSKMNILMQYKYLSKPIAIVLLYLIGSNILRYLSYLFMVVHLTSETYHVFQFRGQLDSLTYLSKFWILFGILLSFDFTMEMVLGYIPFPMLMNIIRVPYLLWLTYEPASVISTYSHIEPYIKIVSETYSTLLLYAFALLF